MTYVSDEATDVTVIVTGEITLTRADLDNAGGNLEQAVQNELGHSGLMVVGAEVAG